MALLFPHAREPFAYENAPTESGPDDQRDPPFGDGSAPSLRAAIGECVLAVHILPNAVRGPRRARRAPQTPLSGI